MPNTFTVIDDFEAQSEQKPPKKPRPNLHLDALAEFMADVDTAPPDLPALQRLNLEGAPCWYYAGQNGVRGKAAHGSIVAEIKNQEGVTVNTAIICDIDGLVYQHFFFDLAVGTYARIGKTPTKELLLTTSWADGMVLHRATSLPVAVVFSADNIRSVTEQLAARYSDVQVTICVSLCGNEPALYAATQVAHRLRIGLAIPPEDHQTFLDCYNRDETKSLAQCLDNVEVPAEPVPLEPLLKRVRANLIRKIDELATLDDESFFARMSAAGQILGLPEANVNYLRNAALGKDLQQGQGVNFPPTPNHPYPKIKSTVSSAFGTPSVRGHTISIRNYQFCKYRTRHQR